MGADADVGFAGSGPPPDSTPVERSGTYGVIDNDRQILQQFVGALGFARAALRQALL